LHKIVLKNDEMQIFSALGDILLLWKPKALSNSPDVPVTKMISV